jgi:hypothetical protein
MNNYTTCSGDCHQGRKPCPCPEACELPEPEFPLTPGENAFLWTGIIGGLSVFAWGVSVLFGTNPF